VEWVGFQLCLKGARLGLSELRAQWLINWLTATAQRGTVKIAELASVDCWAPVLWFNSAGAFEAFLRAHLRMGCSNERLWRV
jgi:hypothetical protein